MTEVTYEQGAVLSADEANFREYIQIAVDYRGDTTIELKDGKSIDGYLFNFLNDTLEIFPPKEDKKVAISVDDVQKIHFSGKDMAKGKSWEEWVKKRAAAMDKKEAEKAEAGDVKAEAEAES